MGVGLNMFLLSPESDEKSGRSRLKVPLSPYLLPPDSKWLAYGF